ncbi:MAG: HNH endonuclease [Candidatus Poribacteria bacterium]|nr:HNH endonuclease [Candidatus Poribacteria bacterium]
MNEEILRKYINEFRNLRIDKAHGNAPHQPVLLLTIIEMIEQEQIEINKIPPSPHLVEKFLKYWNCVTNRKPNPALPFFHLKSRSFWHHHPNPGYEKALEVVSQIKTFPQLRKMISHASLDEELFTLLIQPLEREILRKTLIDKYFLGLTNEIQSVISEEQQISGFSKELLDYVQHDFSTELDEPIESEKKIREHGFRRTIMRIYDYTCAVCKLQILTLNGESVTEAAHIIPFNRSNNDDVRNGISLCKLHHWAFDKYLISVDESYNVIVSELMTERGPTEWMLKTLCGKAILLPKQKELYPAQDALAWHREKVCRQ